MNIFFLDQNLEKCAQYHVDKHVVKMRLELAQIACTVHHLSGTPTDYVHYKSTHVHHPSVVWTAQDLANYCYVVNLGLQLTEELKFRFNTKDQKVIPVLDWLANNLPNIDFKGFTAPLIAMDDQFKVMPVNNLSDAISNYRNYYNLGKTHLFKWTNRPKPEFIN